MNIIQKGNKLEIRFPLYMGEIPITQEDSTHITLTLHYPSGNVQPMTATYEVGTGDWAGKNFMKCTLLPTQQTEIGVYFLVATYGSDALVDSEKFAICERTFEQYKDTDSLLVDREANLNPATLNFGNKGDKGDTGATGAAGQNGQNGADAKINGYNVLTIEGNAVTQQGSRLIITAVSQTDLANKQDKLNNISENGTTTKIATSDDEDTIIVEDGDVTITSDTINLNGNEVYCNGDEVATIAAIGDLDDLTTSDKSTLVSAINEAAGEARSDSDRLETVEGELTQLGLKVGSLEVDVLPYELKDQNTAGTTYRRKAFDVKSGMRISIHLYKSFNYGFKIQVEDDNGIVLQDSTYYSDGLKELDITVNGSLYVVISRYNTSSAYFSVHLINFRYNTDNILRSIYESAGAFYNEITGYYELNGLTDITESQMCDIYSTETLNIASSDTLTSDIGNVRKNFASKARTNRIRNFNNAGIGSGYGHCFGSFMNSRMEVINLLNNRSNNTKAQIGNSMYMFSGCSSLKKIIGKIKLLTSTNNTFTNCDKLEEINLIELTLSVSLAQSRNLTAGSIHYMIANASNTSAITITLHATAKANWEASEYYTEDTATCETKNITIATF